jgi:hypothetical protein
MIAVIVIAMAAVMMVMVGVMMGILVGMNDNRIVVSVEGAGLLRGQKQFLIIIIIIRMPEFRGRNAARRSFDVRLYARIELLLRIERCFGCAYDLIVAYIHGLIAQRSYKRNNETQPCPPAFRKNP